jgi:hypothetical protein
MWVLLGVDERFKPTLEGRPAIFFIAKFGLRAFICNLAAF